MTVQRDHPVQVPGLGALSFALLGRVLRLYAPHGRHDACPGFQAAR